ncbi:hypothetical protein SOVF_060360, partial [Spinacia oleracea]
SDFPPLLLPTLSNPNPTPEMKIVAACLLSALGGKACPTVDDIKKNLISACSINVSVQTNKAVASQCNKIRDALFGDQITTSQRCPPTQRDL